MRAFEFITEDEVKHVAFCFGRLNPPTIGHKKLLDTVGGIGNDYKIFLSQSQDSKKNPLDYETKVKFIRAMFPDHAQNVVDDRNLNTVVKVASYLYDQGYRHATFVAGSDRLADMEKLLSQYNGVEGKAHGFYKFDTLDFKSSGEREDGVEGVEGVSASGARLAAANNDYKSFQEATGAGKYAKALFDAVRKGMGIEENVAEARMSAQVKLQRAWERQQEKSAASRKRGQELLNPPKKDEPKKDVAEGEFRKINIEDKVINNDKLNDLKSKYLPDWEMLDHRILQAKYVARDHRHALEFVEFINELSEKMDHFAEVTQDVAEVTVKTTTFDVKGLTILDFRLALKVDKYAESNDIEQVRMQGNFGMHESRRGSKQKRSS